MKSLLAVMLVFATIFANAATIQWQSGSLARAAGVTGGAGSDSIKSYIAEGTTLDMMVYLVEQSVYDSYASSSQLDIWSAYSSKSASATCSREPGVSGKLTAESTASISVSQYAIILAKYKDVDYGAMYMATRAMIDGATITNPDGTYQVSSILTSSTGVANNWQPVPEPSSGLLLLLGMAGLALRRKQKKA